MDGLRRRSLAGKPNMRSFAAGSYFASSEDSIIASPNGLDLMLADIGLQSYAHWSQ